MKKIIMNIARKGGQYMPLKSWLKLHLRNSHEHSKTVYDNLYAKPSPLGQHQHCSVVVLFSVEGSIHYGQFNFLDNLWTTIPADSKMRQFKDRHVEYWFYPPRSMNIFKEYAKDVYSKRCVDDVSRLKEYKEDCDERSIEETDLLIDTDKAAEVLVNLP